MLTQNIPDYLRFKGNLLFSCGRLPLFILFLFFPISLWCVDTAPLSEEQMVRRCHAHLVIGDVRRADLEAVEGLKLYPTAERLHEVHVGAMASLGMDKAMMKGWDDYLHAVPAGIENRRLMEQMAWGLLQHGAESSAPLIRLISGIGAFQSKDARGVSLISKSLSDSNIIVREMAIQFASQMGDQIFKDALLRMLDGEEVFSLRLEIIRGLGALRVHQATDVLMNIAASDASLAEEKSAAIEALVNMYEKLDRTQLQHLIKSDRAGLRNIACSAVVALHLKEALDLIAPLVKDHVAEVRAAALTAIGLLNPNLTIEIPLDDPNPQVAITAAWLLMLQHPQKGAEAFQKWLSHSSQEIRLFAVVALAAAGNASDEALLTAFEMQKDPYEKLNLALGLINRRLHTASAGSFLSQFLTENRDRVLTKTVGHFKMVVPAQMINISSGLFDIETLNQMTRLELLNSLALVDHKKAQIAIRDFLGNYQWGVTGVAALLLLQEGDETVLDIIKGLLNDPNIKVRVQAGLALAVWGRDSAALKTLEESYFASDRQLKEKILEAIGRMGTKESIPFLIERLREPYQILRLIASAELVALLNN